MVKTSTKQTKVTEQGQDEAANFMNDELFYNLIKKDLNKLIREPSEETIQKIMKISSDL